VEALLTAGAKADGADYSRITPLHLAARAGHSACVEALLKRGGNANARSDAGVTPLHEAAFAGSGLSVAALTKAGSDRLARDARGRTPRDVAQTRGHRDLLAMLAAKDGSTVSAASRSPVTTAAMLR
jgi:ankyrin repeat protein